MDTSVVLCTYNGAKFVRQQILSVINQSVPPAEILISDDGSTDDTLSIIEGVLTNHDIPFKIFRNENRVGPARNFELLARKAAGDIVFFCDQDDIWYPNKIETCVSELARHPYAVLVFSDADCVDASGTLLGYTAWDCIGRDSIFRLFDVEVCQLSSVLQRDLVTGASMAVRKTFFDLAFPIPDGWLHDAWLACVAAVGNRIYPIQSCLLKYRLHEGQTVSLNKTLFAKITRAFQVGSQKSKFTDFESRLTPIVEAMSGDKQMLLSLIKEKVAHINARNSLPKLRWRRLSRVLKELICGRYHRYSSGFKSAALDLIK